MNHWFCKVCGRGMKSMGNAAAFDHLCADCDPRSRDERFLARRAYYDARDARRRAKGTRGASV